jgi:hypothetical protein
MSGGPVINPAQEDEQGDALPGIPPPSPAPDLSAKINVPLNLGNANQIISSSGLGAQHNTSHTQFLGQRGNGGDDEDLEGGEDVESAGGAAEGAAGAAEVGTDLAELAGLAVLA